MEGGGGEEGRRKVRYKWREDGYKVEGGRGGSGREDTKQRRGKTNQKSLVPIQVGSHSTPVVAWKQNRCYLGNRTGVTFRYVCPQELLVTFLLLDELKVNKLHHACNGDG